VQLSPVVLKKAEEMSDLGDTDNEVDVVKETWNVGRVQL
jgi:hypothetical protein